MYQKLIIIGNLGRDPEMRYTPDGKAVTTFSVWGKQAESCNQYLTKGSKVLVEGRLRPDANTGAPQVFQKKDGSWGSSYEVYADTVRFLSARGEGNPETSDTVDDDDIPF